jgi:hypothetical protein
MNKILLFILKIILIGFLIQLFCFYIAPLLVYFAYIYFNKDLGFFMDFENFYKSLVIICCFFYLLFSIFDLFVTFILYHKYGKNVLYLILFICFLICLL